MADSVDQATTAGCFAARSSQSGLPCICDRQSFGGACRWSPEARPRQFGCFIGVSFMRVFARVRVIAGLGDEACGADEAYSDRQQPVGMIPCHVREPHHRRDKPKSADGAVREAQLAPIRLGWFAQALLGPVRVHPRP
jgi:hypothetical protein